jgi:hypothetical protein
MTKLGAEAGTDGGAVLTSIIVVQNCQEELKRLEHTEAPF